MLRVANLLRSAVKNPKVYRAGVPGWDRPDPPPTTRVQQAQEFTDQQICFFFMDGSMPEFILTQPQIYEGDTNMQAMPTFLRGWGVFTALALGLAFTLNFLTPIISDLTPSWNGWNYVYESHKKSMQERKMLNWAKENPFGVEVSHEFYPTHAYGKVDMAPGLVHMKDEIRKKEKLHEEAKTYFSKLREQCRQKVRASPPSH